MQTVFLTLLGVGITITLLVWFFVAPLIGNIITQLVYAAQMVGG